MPYAAPTRRTRCTAPQRKVPSAYDRTADRVEAKRFYKSPQWRRCREAFLAGKPLCVDCRKRGVIRPAEHVHHKLERRDRPDLAFDHDNLEGLCQPHHNARRAGGHQR